MIMTHILDLLAFPIHHIIWSSNPLYFLQMELMGPALTVTRLHSFLADRARHLECMPELEKGKCGILTWGKILNKPI